MNKAVLISIQPKWCELIAIGKKTVEVRKTKPKLPTPFKCYIYQTNQSWVYNIYSAIADWQGKVIGEFLCDEWDFYPHRKSDTADYYFVDSDSLKEMCLSYKALWEYGKNSKILYGWHISDLVIYDKPRELSDFYSHCDRSGNADDRICQTCPNLYFDHDPISGYTRWCGVYKRKPLTRSPQSWCYAESLEDTQ